MISSELFGLSFYISESPTDAESAWQNPHRPFIITVFISGLVNSSFIFVNPLLFVDIAGLVILGEIETERALKPTKDGATVSHVRDEHPIIHHETETGTAARFYQILLTLFSRQTKERLFAFRTTFQNSLFNITRKTCLT